METDPDPGPEDTPSEGEKRRPGSRRSPMTPELRRFLGRGRSWHDWLPEVVACASELAVACDPVPCVPTICASAAELDPIVSAAALVISAMR